MNIHVKEDEKKKKNIARAITSNHTYCERERERERIVCTMAMNR